jgi:mannose-1-phosphate guanylyltransferase / phosphomannomutase
MKAVIMAGGEGTRLRPLTSNQPKPMVPVINKPVMEYIIELLKNHGITDVIATLQFLPALIRNYFGDGQDLGVNIAYSTEESPLGTAGSVKKVEQYLDETFIVISGDAMTDIDLTAAVAFHKKNRALATLVLKSVPNPLQFGVVITDDDGRIQRFVEKPNWSQVFSDTVNTGIYILDPKIFAHIPDDQPFDFSKDLFPKLLKGRKRLFGYVADGYWQDIGSIEQYMQVHQDLLRGETMFKPEGFKIGRSVWLDGGAQVDPMASLRGPIVIGKNAKIEAGARIRPYSVIGNNTVVKAGSFVSRAVIGENCYIGAGAELRGCAIGRTCDVKRSVRIDEGVAIGDNCSIGEGSVISPGVRIYPFKTVEPGAAVSASIIWETRGVRSLFGRQGIAGLINIDITPRMAMRIAVSYGTAVPAGSTVAVSSDQVRSCDIMRQSIIAGLNSTGVNVWDIGNMPAAVTRHAIINDHLAGGIDIRLSRDDDQSVEFDFFETSGINIGEAMQGNVEKSFYRGDFRRAFHNEMGEVIYPPHTAENYINNVLGKLDVELIRKARFKLVVDYGFGRGIKVGPELFGRLGVGVIALNGHAGSTRAALDKDEVERSLRQVSQSVRALQADMGVIIDGPSERVIFVDEKGQRIGQSAALIMMMKLICESKKAGTVVLPMSVTQTADDIAALNNCDVKRVRISPAALMEAALEEQSIFAGAEGGGYIFPDIVPAYAALSSVGKLLELLAVTKKPISASAAQVPRYHVQHRQEVCSWDRKGFVMRQMMDATKGRKVELTDGIKVYTPHGWALMLPDPVEPICHIYVEGDSEQQADTIAARYAGMIRKFRA